MLLRMMCSSTLQETDVIESVLWFDGDERFPFFKTSATRAVFQSRGI